VEEKKLAMILGDETRLRILKIIYESGEVRGADLPRLLGKHRSTISRHLSILLKYSFIKREVRNGDFYYSLTDRGKAIVSTLIQTEFKPIIEVPIKKYSTKEVIKGSKVLKVVALAVSIALGAIGVAGLFVPAEVHAFSRIVWLIIWLSAAICTYYISKKLLRIFS